MYCKECIKQGQKSTVHQGSSSTNPDGSVALVSYTCSREHTWSATPPQEKKSSEVYAKKAESISKAESVHISGGPAEAHLSTDSPSNQFIITSSSPATLKLAETRIACPRCGHSTTEEMFDGFHVNIPGPLRGFYCASCFADFISKNVPKMVPENQIAKAVPSADDAGMNTKG